MFGMVTDATTIVWKGSNFYHEWHYARQLDDSVENSLITTTPATLLMLSGLHLLWVGLNAMFMPLFQ